jgi:hypothetical protein
MKYSRTNFILISAIAIALSISVAGHLFPSKAEAQKKIARSLIVISVDGLDHRYLRDCDKLGLKIPHLRRLMKEGEWTDGVVGVLPTVTWP